MKTKTQLTNRILSLVLAFVMVLGMLPLSSFTALAAEAATDLNVNITGADGNPKSVTLKDADSDGYYDIGTADELYAFAAAVNGGNTAINGELTADIDLESRAWTPITKFTGTFDGAGHAIKNFAMNITAKGDYGLFGFVKNATIKDFTIYGEVESKLTAKPDEFNYGVIGEAEGSTIITDVHSYVNLTIKDNYYRNFVGGIIGRNNQSGANFAIERCSFSGTLDLGAAQVDCTGGIIAYVMAGHTVKLNDCLFDGQIISTYNGGPMQIGGLLGYYKGSALTITNSLSIGDITVNNNAWMGAIVGLLREHNSANQKVTNNYYLEETQPFGNNSETTTEITDGYEGQTVAGSATAATEAQLKSGETAYLLQGEQETHVWGQTIGEQNYPVLGGAKVYYGYTSCANDAEMVYTNNENASGQRVHSGVTATYNGDGTHKVTCSDCGETVTEREACSVDLATGKCVACGTQFQASLTMSGVTTYYGNVGNAISAARNSTDKSTRLTLLADLDGYVHINRGTFTLDLNGHSIRNRGAGAAVEIEGANVEITGDGTLTGNYSVSASDGSVLISGGTHQAHSVTINYSKAAVTITGGTFEGRSKVFYNNLVGNEDLPVLSGGTFPKGIVIGFAGSAPVSMLISDLLATGYCYWQDGSVLVTGNATSITGSVTVAQCDHSEGLEDAPYTGNGDGTHNKSCATCGTAVVENEVCSGGTATCTNQTVCQKCGVPYGELDSTNHDETVNFDENGFCPNGCYEPAVLNENGYYEIGNAGQLFWFADYVNNVSNEINVKLMDNITVPEGMTWNPVMDFCGTFDGNFKTVSGLYVKSEGDNVGMFGGGLYARGTIKNLGLTDSHFEGSSYVGGIAGYHEGTIENCYVDGSVTVVGESITGMLVGNNAGTVRNCYAYGSSFVGHFNNSNGSIENCYFLSDTEDSFDGTTAMTAEAFASGEVAYLLQSGVTVYDEVLGDYTTEGAPHIWGQTCGTGLPTLGGPKVYRIQGSPCTARFVYANDENAQVTIPHDYTDNGFCKHCDDYESAVLNEDGYYEIGNAGQLYWFAQQVNGGNNAINGELTADIVVNENVLTEAGELNSTDEGFRVWTPIGNNNIRYTGTFDGKGHTVSGLYFNDPAADYVGLFGYVSWGTVQNVGVVDSYLSGNYYIGGVVGFNLISTITDCYNTAPVSGTAYVGGFVGTNNSGTITDCYNTAPVSGTSYVGGFVGRNNYETITNCYNTGAVTGSGSLVGGVAGYNTGDGSITECYNTGAVSSAAYVGGVVGENYQGLITGCHNTGTVTGNDYIGGVVGNNRKTVTNCYYLTGTATGGINGADATGQAEAKTEAQFASGEVAYLLNSGVTDGTQAFYQTVDEGLPSFSGETVYQVKNCNDETVYSNVDAIRHIQLENGVCTACGVACAHPVCKNGFCATCGGYQNAVLNEDGYYEIGNAGQMYWFSELVNGALYDVEQNVSANAVLLNDITLNEHLFDSDGNLVSNTDALHVWTPIGFGSTYLGIFDGQDHTVSGLYYSNTENNDVGLFGRSDGTIRNITVENSYLKGGKYIGSIVGRNYGNVYNCASVGCVIDAAAGLAGGIVGLTNNDGIIDNCYNTSTVSGTERIGGICGDLESNGSITNCYNTGAVTSTGNYVGGIAGFNGYNGVSTIKDCYNTGSVSGQQRVGGISGCLQHGGTVTNCYNTGTVTGTGYFGGIVGIVPNNDTSANCKVESCYFNSDVFAGSGVGYIANYGTVNFVEGKTTKQFASGEVAYLLNSGVTDGTQVFYQTIGTDPIPKFAGSTVYKVSCVEYSNENKDYVPHNFVDGICSRCGEYDTFEISNVDQYVWFAEFVNTGNAGANAKLMADIDLSEYGNVMIGTSTTKYSGSFNGNGKKLTVSFNTTEEYAAPFRYINDATIHDLTVDGTIATSAKFAAGLVGCSDGTSKIEKCMVGVTIDSSVNGDGTHGGLVANVNSGSMAIENCGFIGSITGGATHSCGGFVGWANGNVTIKHSYICGTFTTGTNSCNTFGRNAKNITVSDSYYKTTYGTNNTGATQKSADQFARGEVAYLLNGGVTDGTQVFYQTIGTDPIPKFAGSTVYKVSCEGAEYYSNENKNYETHNFVDDICSRCGEYQPAELNSDGYYEIGNAGQLYWFSGLVNGALYDVEQNVSANAVLLNDITLNEHLFDSDGNLVSNTDALHVWTPIGFGSTYLGIFDGQDHTVSGLYYSNTEKNYVGLFGRSDGTIRNITVENSYLKGGKYIGGIVGGNYGNVYNCASVGCVIDAAAGLAGGIVGVTNDDGIIDNCYNTSTVSGTERIGGICGDLESNGSITNCYNTGAVTSTGNNVGGIAGFNGINGVSTIKDCYNTGSVSGQQRVGGISGCLQYGGTVTNCYNTGTVTGTGYFGGIVGIVPNDDDNVNCKVENCYFNSDVFAGSGVGHIANYGTVNFVEGKTTKQFASGQVAYLLNSGVTDGTQVFYQTIGTDPIPKFAGSTVYKVSCADAECYRNENKNYETHNFVDGICSHCGEYQPAELNSDGYYEIGNAGQLYWFSELVNGALYDVEQNVSANAVLLNDITLNEHLFDSDGNLVSNTDALHMWTPIGFGSTYLGIFDGQDHTVSGLYYSNTEKNYVGLFGRSDGTIRNITVENSYLKGGKYISGIVGWNNGSVYNCASVGCVIDAAAGRAGGIVGVTNDDGIIDNCYNTSTVSGTERVGGISGCLQYGGTVTNCYNTGTVTGTGYFGGIVGIIPNDDTSANCKVESCYFNSDVFAGSGVGRIANYGTVNFVEGKTTKQFASGEVAYLLNSGVTDGTQVFYQTIGTDPIPKFAGGTVYKVSCVDAECYRNENKNYETHNFVDDICSRCGEYQPAELNSDGYYEIGNKGQLYWFAQQVNIEGDTDANAILMADLDLEGYEWTTICETGLYYRGYGTDTDLGYCGTFDGNGHIIKNITVKSSTTMDASCGLFGTVSGTIKNLGVEGFTFVDGGKDIRAGAIVGQLITANGKVSDCYVKGATITPGEHVTGGIAGCVYEGTIENCYVVESTITGTEERFGHVVGDSRGDINESDRPGTVTNCYSDNETLRSDRKGNVINCETKSKEAFASGEVAYLLQGEQETHVWGQTIGTNAYPTLGGEKVYMLSDGTYSNMMPGAVAQVGRTQYTTVQEAVDNANGSYVKLLADSAETVTATGDLYLDLNGYELAALTVTDGTLYGMDATTDDYDCADGYGTIGTFTGTYESQHRTDITGAVRRYVAISEDGKLSFHRIYAAVTHTSLRPANAGFGYKASFYGDQMIQKYMTGYGFNVWISEDNKLSRSATDFVAGADGNIKTLRINNILSGADTDATAAQTLIYAEAYASLTVNGTVIQIESDPVSGTLVDLINAVNGNTAAYSTEQLAAVKTMLETYSAALEKAGCEMDNILN